MRTQERTETTTSETAKGTLKRRGILAAAGAVVAGIIAKQASEPAAAVGEIFTIPGDYTANQIGTVWRITNTGSGDALEGIGVAQGIGGFASGAGGIGVFGNTPSGTGQGVYGRNSGTNGTATYGESQAGVVGKGVYGKTTANGFGVYGEATTTNGYGVHGIVTNGDVNARGVSGNSGSVGYGVYGTSTNGYGVYGTVSGGIGVGGYSNGNGIVGTTGGTGTVAGVYGTSTSAYGVIGATTAAGYSGLTAITGTAGVAALAATSTVPTAFAAYFTGATVVQGNFTAFGGSKSAAVPDASGQHRLVYCVESPESWFEDFGTGTLVAGKAEVNLDPLFAQIVHTDDYHVFVTEHGGHSGLHTTRKGAGGFSVAADGELAAAKGKKAAELTGTFSWRLVAKRKDITGERLAKFDLPKIKAPDLAALAKHELPKPDTGKKA